MGHAVASRSIPNQLRPTRSPRSTNLPFYDETVSRIALISQGVRDDIVALGKIHPPGRWLLGGEVIQNSLDDGGKIPARRYASRRSRLQDVDSHRVVSLTIPTRLNTTSEWSFSFFFSSVMALGFSFYCSYENRLSLADAHHRSIRKRRVDFSAGEGDGVVGQRRLERALGD